MFIYFFLFTKQMNSLLSILFCIMTHENLQCQSNKSYNAFLLLILITRIAVTGAAPTLDEDGGGGDEGDLQHRHHGRHPAQGAHLASQVAAHGLVTPAGVNTARCRAEYKI